MKNNSSLQKKLVTAFIFGVALSLIVSCTTTKEPVTPETALQSYLQNGDESFAWEISGSQEINGLTAYSLMLTSQTWREHTWKHTLTVIVPQNINHDGAMLFITGGKNEDGMPLVRGGDAEFIQTMAMVAMKNSAVVSILWQIPNQPLYDDLTEDELISYTLHNYRNDGDFTWPLLFPMVKGAVRAMDAVQAFSKETLGQEISRFLVTGASKRGWTTWLTGASDARAEAIAPMVIDVLNMPVNLDYQVEVWGDYSIQIQDYVRLGIPQEVHTEYGSDFTTMIDPYSYRDKLVMPKMIFIGTNDEYWPVDAIKHYIADIPGDNHIHYVPNAGHGLGDKIQALAALSAFFGQTLLQEGYPVCKWSLTENGGQPALTVKTSPDRLEGARFWSADSQDRDFRDETWSSTDVEKGDQEEIEVLVALPGSGFRAFYVDLLYTGPDGEAYSESTRMFVADGTGVLEK